MHAYGYTAVSYVTTQPRLAANAALNAPSGVAVTGSTIRHVAQYDADSRLTSLTTTDPIMPTFAYGYNGAGWITSVTALSGADTVAHDPATGRLAGESGPTVIAPNRAYNWSYDKDGNITAATTDEGGVVTYNYNASQPNELQSLYSPNYPNPFTYYSDDGSGDTTSITGRSTGPTPPPQRSTRASSTTRRPGPSGSCCSTTPTAGHSR